VHATASSGQVVGSGRHASASQLDDLRWGFLLPQVPRPEVCLTLDSVERLMALFESELRHRRLFVAGKFALGARERCSLVILDAQSRAFCVEAEAVYIRLEDPEAGVGLDLVGLDSAKLAELEVFVHQKTEDPPATATGPRNLYERIRQLSLRERDAVARLGLLSDRIALERVYGSSVWEALLQNPQLTLPEVAHIAKNGTLPIPLVAAIVANHGWMASGEVRRALLGNPRASGPHLDRVLKATPRAELKQIAQMSPYRTQVRAAAKKLVGE
jgi:hypothetical protein